MIINFDKSLEDYQNARKLQLVLRNAEHNEHDESILLLLSSLNRQVESFLSDPEFDKFRESYPDNFETDTGRRPPLLTGLFSLWRSLAGPSHKELELSRQRRELIERAEHAETMAFEALAETAEIRKDRENTMEKIRLLQEEVARLKNA